LGPATERHPGTIAYSQSHYDEVNHRGKTTIEVTANDPNNTQSRDQIWHHLTHIAEMFSAGNFNAPVFIHDQTPPGVPVMKSTDERN
jgi:hypothetical protein